MPQVQRWQHYPQRATVSVYIITPYPTNGIATPSSFCVFLKPAVKARPEQPWPTISYPGTVLVAFRTHSRHHQHRYPPDGLGRHRGLAAIGALATVCAVAACGGPSPVDMDEHPITDSTPSRAAGAELVRSGDPQESCAEQPVPADPLDIPAADPRVPESPSPDARSVPVPRNPQRIVALGLTAVDTACALGLQDRLVAVAPLPAGAATLYPAGVIDTSVVDPQAPDAATRIAELSPDIVLLGADASARAAELRSVLGDAISIVSYADPTTSWNEATSRAGAALARADAIDSLLLDFLGDVRDGGQATNAANTLVSVVTVNGTEPQVAPPEMLGVRVVEAFGAGRPPAQLTADGQAVAPPQYQPVVGDVLAGDVIFVVLSGEPGAEDRLRTVFGSSRWQDLPATQHRRVFVVDGIAWQGRGLVAARAVLADLTAKINSIAADG